MADTPERAADILDRNWRLLVLLFWLAASAYMIFDRWNAIRGFSLGDTDDNMRMMQVRALLDGQGWYDLRQYRLNPPWGADIHWSRLVDLPIAGLKLAFTPLFGGRIAEQIAVAVAPLLPMLVTMHALALTVRRLVAPLAWPLALAILLCAGSTMGMWQPLRIDHHGWQLATVAVLLAALTDPRPARGGLIAGVTTALSLAIGLEMLPYLAIGGVAIALRWVWDGAEARRLATYGVSLAGGAALGYLLFASIANRAPVCDALSPVWLSAMLVAGALALVLARLSPAGRGARFALAAGAGLLLGGSFLIAWPNCIGRPEHSSPELERLWLSKVREAMPFWRHGTETAILIITLPAIGVLGYILMLWAHRRDAARLIGWASIALAALTATGLLFWQTRAGPAAQMLAVPAAAGFAWEVIAWLYRRDSLLLRVGGAVVTFAIVSGMVSGFGARYFRKPTSDYRRTVNIANNRCASLAALAPIARQPRGLVLTFVDLGPRLITVTPHDAIAGPYHRNGQQIIDVMHAWRGSAQNAHATARHYRVNYVLICPNMSESTIYRAEAPGGFYTQLAAGRVPAWLAPVALPADSPFKMWRVVG